MVTLNRSKLVAKEDAGNGLERLRGWTFFIFEAMMNENGKHFFIGRTTAQRWA
jgi:hypothetical protein